MGGGAANFLATAAAGITFVLMLSYLGPWPALGPRKVASGNIPTAIHCMPRGASVQAGPGKRWSARRSAADFPRELLDLELVGIGVPLELAGGGLRAVLVVID